jgi:imidazolonepropionase-like amidohydrolase
MERNKTKLIMPPLFLAWHVRKPLICMKKLLLKVSMLGMLGITLISQVLWAQSDPTGKRAVTKTFAITNATVFASPGKPGAKTTILIKDGVIIGVGNNLNLPKEAKLIPGDSLYVYPGFIDGAGMAGVTKPKDPERPQDFIASNPPDEIAGITPWRSAVEQFSVTGSQVEDWRKTGFTLAQVVPDGGMLPGKTALILYGSEKASNVIQVNAALAANFRGARGMYPGTAAGVMAKFRDVYENSLLAQTHSQQFASTAGVKRPEITPTHAAMFEVINKQIPVLFTATSELEIRRAIALQKEFGYSLILTGLEDYAGVIDVIKSSGAKVLIKLETPDDKAIKAQKEDASETQKAQYARVKAAYEQTLKQAGLLEKAGIPFAFTTSGAKPGEAMKSLRNMIANGLSEQAALAALTTNPASILGVSRFAGSIENGKMANLVISTDSIFKEDAQIKHVVVDGNIFDYEVKAKKPANGKDADANGSNPKIEGVWNYTSETPAGSSAGEIMIKKEGSGFSGTITYDDPSGSGKVSTPIKNVSVSGKSLSFQFDVAAGGMNLTVDISGEISDNTMDGTMSVGQFGSFPLSAILSSPAQTTF